MPCTPALSAAPFLPRPFCRALSAAPFLPRLIASLALAVLASVCHADPLPWDSGKQGAYITALCADTQGRTVVATEGNGVWRYDPTTKQYAHFTQKDGLGSDDVYALASDAKGRLWAGTLRGLSVYNGHAWKTYGPLEGVGGWRTFALATCPADGDIWVATEGGLTRYSLHEGTWTQYSRLEGLPSDAFSCLAFNARGDLYAGTQADGIAIAAARDNYKTWRVIPGPARPPAAPGGSGLPTALINCLLATSGGAVYAGTDDGLARSEDGGRDWRFLRGADWAAKADGGRAEAGLVDNADVHAIEVLPLDDPQEPPVRIHAGGGAVGNFQADVDFDGGQTFTTTDPIDTRAALNPAPAAAYQTSRWGSFTYSIPALRPGHRYRVRLHLAEIGWRDAGRRAFDVSLNGKPALTHFDIFAEAGGRDRAIVRDFVAPADAQGRIVLAFQGTAPLLSHTNAYALREDYVTCLAGDGRGGLLIGHWQQGLEDVSLKTGATLFPRPQDAEPTDDVTALLPRPDGTALIGGYGGGLMQKPLPGVPIAAPSVTTSAPPVVASAPKVLPPLPEPAKPPTLAELNAMLRVVSAVPPDPQEMQPKAVALDDDWLTEGDWLGRYGRYWACLCAICSPSDYQWGAGWEPVNYDLQIGPNHNTADALRYWVATNYATENYCLELPPTYLDSRIKKGLTTPELSRRQAEVDDHGEVYPMTKDGPGIYSTLTVPPGLYYLSLYEDNYSAHSGTWRGFYYAWGEKFRDLRLSVRPHAGAGLDDVSHFAQAPEWAHGRVYGFRQGVWKRFLVRGPTTLTVEVGRNHSMNTILPAVMLDLVDENPPPYFKTVNQWEQEQANQEKLRRQLLARGRPSGRFRLAASESGAANRLFIALEQVQIINSLWWAINGRRFYLPLLRWYASQAKMTSVSQLLGTCYYRLGLYPQWEGVQRLAKLTPARDVEKALRWDGLTYDNRGKGYVVVNNLLSAKAHGSTSVRTLY